MFAPGAGRLILPPLILAVFFGALGVIHVLPFAIWLYGLLFGLAALSGFFAWFFRDPERPVGPGIVSAADGRVRAVSREAECWRVSVFMNVTDVHVNRFPVAGRVDRIEDEGAGFRPAYLPDSVHNVRRHYHLSTPLGSVEVIQMTGILARRLVSLVRPGDERPKGARLGLIVLGSRVDVLISADHARPVVNVGDRVRAGFSRIAEEIL